MVFLALVSLSSVVRFYTDLLWFHELKLNAVFWRIVSTRLALGLVGGVVTAAIIYVNLEVARATAPKYRFVSPAGEVAERYRSMFQPYARWANIGIAALVGLLTGLSTSAAWERFQLWRHAQPFGTRDPVFGRDIGFYVFSVPFQRVVLSWLFGVVILTILLALLAHLLNGSIEPEANRIAFQPVVKVHTSVLLGVIALLKAWGYVLAQYDLLTSPRGAVTGASYTDVHAQRPALQLLVVIAVLCAVIFFVNIRFRGWMLPVIAVGLWAFSSAVIGALIPWAFQRFRVEPNESVRERPFIQRNIDATRSAFGLSKLELKEFPADNSLNPQVLSQESETVENIRLWDPDVLINTYRRRQAIRQYYDFHDVDIDRYVVDGRERQVMLAARQLDPAHLEDRARNWINTRLTYTHGFGIVANTASSATPKGEPSLLVHDLPQLGPDNLIPEQAGVYFGEGIEEYVLVRTKQKEIDYPIGEKNQTTTYRGEGGVPLSNPMRRLAFAARFADTNILISNFISGDTRAMFRRDIKERARAAAPFLRFDRDPYIVSVDGRLLWILDAYTETDRYPYAQELELAAIFPTDHAGRVNYIRNSVKVVIDAYDGSMTFYVVDASDPLVNTYKSIFPEMFTPFDRMPQSLRAHLRYPEDQFVVQMVQYRLYHATDPDRVYSREDVWDFPADPTKSTDAAKVAMEPYYVLMKLPGEEEEEFLLMLPFTPRNRPNLNGWVAARSDPENYGEIVGFSFPRGQSIEGPENIAARIEQEPTISSQFTVWDRAGSSVLRGNLLVIPIGTSLIYVQPIYLQADQSAIPELVRVIVVYSDRIAFEPNLETALAKALGGPAPAAPAPVGVEPSPDTGADVGTLLDRAADHFAKADEALRNGDLAGYQRENKAARDAIEEARRREQAA